MPAKDLKFLNFDRSGEVGSNLECTINEDDLKIVMSTVLTRATFVSETGVETDTHADLILGSNTAIVNIPEMLEPGKYGFGIVLTDLNTPNEKWIISTPLDAITIRNKSGETHPSIPVVDMVKFQGSMQEIHQSELLTTPLLVTGSRLNLIKECRLSAMPALVFNVVSKTPTSLTLKALNSCFIGEGEHVTRVSFRYEVNNELGVVIEQGLISAPQTLTIIGD